MQKYYLFDHDGDHYWLNGEPFSVMAGSLGDACVEALYRLQHITFPDEYENRKLNKIIVDLVVPRKAARLLKVIEANV